MMLAAQDIAVRKIQTPREIDDYIKFAWEVYRGNPLWVPPIYSDIKAFLSGESLFFKHCKHALFTAREDGETVATVAAFYDANLSKHWQRNVGMLGFFEALPDKRNALAALFKEAENFLKAQGAKEIWAPINGGIAHPAGLLANAYNQMPVFLMQYNPSYYHGYFKQLGYRTDTELIAFTMDLLDGRLQRKIRYILRRARNSEIILRTFRMNDFKAECLRLARIYTQTFNQHWAYAPQSDDEILEILNGMRLAIDPRLVIFAEHNGEVVGFVLSMPDYNPVIKKLNGNLNFLTVLEFAREKKKIREARLIAIGASPAWRGKGLAPLLVARAYQTMIEAGYIKTEYSWVANKNLSSQKVARKFYGDPYKHYAIYRKVLDASVAA